MKYQGKVRLQVRNTAGEWVVVTDAAMITLELPRALSTLPSDQPFDLFYDGELRVSRLRRVDFECNLELTEEIRRWVDGVIAAAKRARHAPN
jgi:hypothetical protein